jgi:hypothetical protein
MERHDLDEGAAFELLRTHSRSTSRKPADIAGARGQPSDPARRAARPDPAVAGRARFSAWGPASGLVWWLCAANTPSRTV